MRYKDALRDIAKSTRKGEDWQRLYESASIGYMNIAMNGVQFTDWLFTQCTAKFTDEERKMIANFGDYMINMGNLRELQMHSKGYKPEHIEAIYDEYKKQYEKRFGKKEGNGDSD